MATTPRAFDYMPVVLEYLRTQPNGLFKKAEVRENTNPRVLINGLVYRDHALTFALNYLLKESLIERPKWGHYRILPAGFKPFTRLDGMRLTDKYEGTNISRNLNAR
jgi:hypothetical protein